MRSVLIALALATSSVVAAAQDAGPPPPASTESTLAAAPAPSAETEAPATATAEAPPASAQRCRRVRPTGSRVARRVCTTEAVDAELQERAQDWLNHSGQNVNVGTRN